MRTPVLMFLAAVVCTLAAADYGICIEPAVVALPAGVKAVWDLNQAHRETTATRERICINGLWRWQPAETSVNQPPTANWGQPQVPGPWPGFGRSDRRRRSQSVFRAQAGRAAPSSRRCGLVRARDRSAPKRGPAAGWCSPPSTSIPTRRCMWMAKRRARCCTPRGEVDLTAACRPGGKHVLTIQVAALPLSEVVAVFSDSNAPRQARGEVSRHGLCGDIYLVSEPSGSRIADVKVDASVREWEIAFDTALRD